MCGQIVYLSLSLYVYKSHRTSVVSWKCMRSQSNNSWEQAGVKYQWAYDLMLVSMLH